MEPPANLWQRLLPRLGERKGLHLGSLRLPDFSAVQPLPAIAAVVAMVVLVSGVSILVASPWQGGSSELAVATQTDTPTPAPAQPRAFRAPEGTQDTVGPPGLPGNTVTLSSAFSTDGWRLVQIEMDQAFTDRMIVSNANLTLAVKDIGDAMNEVTQMAEEMGGFVASSTRQGDEGASVTVRVPSERFEETKQALRSIGVRVLSESTQSQDVTEEYVDLQSQLRNWGAAEGQYLELITKARNVDETLKVQQQLVSVRGEIERIKGRVQFLERTSSMASITVQLQPASNRGPLVQPGWSAGETGRSALRSLSEFGQRLAGVAIWVGIYSPVWLLLGFVVFLVGRRVIRG